MDLNIDACARHVDRHLDRRVCQAICLGDSRLDSCEFESLASRDDVEAAMDGSGPVGSQDPSRVSLPVVSPNDWPMGDPLGVPSRPPGRED